MVDEEAPVTLRFANRKTDGNRLTLRDPKSRRRYARYEVRKRLAPEERRLDKAPGSHTVLVQCLSFS